MPSQLRICHQWVIHQNPANSNKSGGVSFRPTLTHKPTFEDRSLMSIFDIWQILRSIGINACHKPQALRYKGPYIQHDCQWGLWCILCKQTHKISEATGLDQGRCKVPESHLMVVKLWKCEPKDDKSLDCSLTVTPTTNCQQNENLIKKNTRVLLSHRVVTISKLTNFTNSFNSLFHGK